MIKISTKLAKELYELDGIGAYFEDFGAVVGDSDFVIYYNSSNQIYLCHISEFNTEKLVIKLKEGF